MMAPTALVSEPGTLRSIYFGFDSAVITDESKTILRDNYQTFKKRGNPHVELAGHTDSRGSEEYNRKLGERRAEAALSYLESLGANRSEFSTVSFGKDLPADPAHTEAAWSRNRRVDFVEK